MVSYFISRIRVLIFSLLFASVVIFMMIEIIPGDPASFMLGINAQADTIEALKNELGLNVSKFQRYLNWVTGMLRGDFGISYTYRVPVSELVLSRLGVSIPLAIYAIILSTIIALPVGLISAAHHGTFKDWSIMGFTQLGIAIPNFWFAMVLVLIFSINLKWFSAGGVPGWDEGLLQNIKALLLICQFGLGFGQLLRTPCFLQHVAWFFLNDLTVYLLNQNEIHLRRYFFYS